MAKVATDFEKIIREGRERKKNEALADKIFSKGRRQSAPSKLNTSTGPSLASRVGVKKSRDSTSSVQQPSLARTKSTRNPAASHGDVNGEWTHDLHSSVNALEPRISRRMKSANKRAARLAAAADLMDISPDAPQQVNIIKPAPANKGLTIRGLAGPFSVMAQNFAPGTTAADIESAMTPVGGEMVSCTVVKTKPIIIVEMVFVSREGGERVIETFNDKTADGRLIKVYPKIGGYQAAPTTSSAPQNAPNGPRASRNKKNDAIVDGSRGFSDLTANSTSNENNGQLYSDRIVGGNRRGRGSQRGRGGRE